MDKRMTYGGNGSHWDGCAEVHWDCKIAQLEADCVISNRELLVKQVEITALRAEIARRDALIERLIEAAASLRHSTYMTRLPDVSDSKINNAGAMEALAKGDEMSEIRDRLWKLALCQSRDEQMPIERVERGE